MRKIVFSIACIFLLSLQSCATFATLIEDFRTSFLTTPTGSTIAPHDTTEPGKPELPRTGLGFMAGDTRNAEPYRTDIPEAGAVVLVKKHPPRSFQSEDQLKNLVIELINTSEDPFLQVKALHDYVALSISYDTDSFFSGKIPDQGWRTVLQTGKAVCEGYSNLMDKMLSLAGFKSIKAHGYARGYGYSIEKADKDLSSNHAWTLVKIAGFWYLIDSTWNSGHLDESGKFNRSYGTDYFLIKPEHMIYSHYPAMKDWQLLSKPVSQETFTDLPFLSGAFFESIRSGYEDLPRKITLDQAATIRFIAEPGKQIIATIKDAAGKERPYAFMQPSNTDSLLYLSPPKGTWRLSLFSGNEKTTRYESIADFTIESTIEETILAPTIYPAARDYKAILVEPLLANISSGQEITIRVRAENVYQVLAVLEGREHPLSVEEEGLHALTLPTGRAKKIDLFVQPTKESRVRKAIFSLPLVP